jgi:Ca2+-binding EF-hand superfamily protein
MKKFFGLVFSLIVMGCGAAAANAQDQPPAGPPPGGFPPGGGMRMQMQMPSFADLDKNKDKKLSRDEFPSQMPQQFFDRLDENKDGFVDEEEWNRSMARFRGGMGGGPRLGETLGKFLDANHDTKVSREEFAHLTQLFDSLDQDKNGELTQEELNGFFRAVNEAQNQATGGVNVSGLFANKDKNKDGKLTADELDERTFRNLDLDKDGFVTKEEAEQALKKISERSKAQGQPNQSNPPKNQ